MAPFRGAAKAAFLCCVALLAIHSAVAARSSATRHHRKLHQDTGANSTVSGVQESLITINYTLAQASPNFSNFTSNFCSGYAASLYTILSLAQAIDGVSPGNCSIQDSAYGPATSIVVSFNATTDSANQVSTMASAQGGMLPGLLTTFVTSLLEVQCGASLTLNVTYANASAAPNFIDYQCNGTYSGSASSLVSPTGQLTVLDPGMCMCVSATQQNAQPVSVSYYTSYIGQAFTGTFLTAVEDTMTKVLGTPFPGSTSNLTVADVYGTDSSNATRYVAAFSVSSTDLAALTTALNQSTEYVISSLFDNLPAPYVCGSAIVIDGLVNGSSVVISCNASIPETLMLANKVIAYNATRLCDCRPAPYVTTIQVINAGYQSTPENATAAITNYTDSVLGNGTLYGGNVSFAALFNGSYYMPSYNLVYELFLAPNDTSALANVTFANSTAEDNFVYSVVPQPITCGAAVVYTVRANGEAVSAVLSCDGTIGANQTNVDAIASAALCNCTAMPPAPPTPPPSPVNASVPNLATLSLVLSTGNNNSVLGVCDALANTVAQALTLAQYPLLSGGSTGGFLNDTADIINNSSSSPSPAPAPAPAPGLAPVNGSYASGAVTNGTITVNVTCSGVDLTASGGAAVSVEFEAPVPVMSTLVALLSDAINSGPRDNLTQSLANYLGKNLTCTSALLLESPQGAVALVCDPALLTNGTQLNNTGVTVVSALGMCSACEGVTPTPSEDSSSSYEFSYSSYVYSSSSSSGSEDSSAAGGESTAPESSTGGVGGVVGGDTSSSPSPDQSAAPATSPSPSPATEQSSGAAYEASGAAEYSVVATAPPSPTSRRALRA